MKKRKLLLHIFCFLTLLNIAILCNESIVFAADTTAPTACNISINTDSSYTNNRFFSLDIYAEDESDMQVWISNDGASGTVTNFELGSTVTITDSDYVIGTALDSTNSTTTSNSDNVFRIQNWPVEDGNGTRTVRVVFNDAYGNKTSLEAYDTITISYDLNGVEGTHKNTDETLYGLNIYLTAPIATAGNQFVGWSTSPSATIPNYYENSSILFDEDTTLYAIYEFGVYATLYENGELVFSNGPGTIEGKTVVKNYGDIKYSHYSETYSNATGFIVDTPWFADGNNLSIKKVTFLNKCTPSNTACWFYYCNNLTNIENLEFLDVSEAIDISRTFQNCLSLQTLDVTNWKTDNVEKMDHLFYYCNNLTSVGDLSNWNTENVTDMKLMFCMCENITGISNLNNWNTSNVTSMIHMFWGCAKINNFEINNWDTSNVTSMKSMFRLCTGLKTLNLSNWNTNNVTDMSYMFYGCSNLTDVYVGSSWKTATTKTNMFSNSGTTDVTVK